MGDSCRAPSLGHLGTGESHGGQLPGTQPGGEDSRQPLAGRAPDSSLRGSGVCSHVACEVREVWQMKALADFLLSFLIQPEGCVPSLVPGAWYLGGT